MKIISGRKHLLAVALSLFASVVLSATAAQAQRADVTIKPNPQNPKRKIVEITPQKQQPQPKRLDVNILDSSSFRRPAIPFKPFEMVHPVSKKPLNPNAEMKIPMPNGRARTTTVKQFFDELNAFELELTRRGHSLREENPFADLKPSAGSKAIVLYGGNTSTTLPAGVIVAAGNAVANLNATLYVSESTPDLGTPEFPPKWMSTSIIAPGRKKFPFLVEVDKSSSPLVSRIEWQVSTQPFTVNASVTNPQGMVLKGDVPKVQTAKDSAQKIQWGTFWGVDLLKPKGTIYASFVVDFSPLGPPPVEPKDYYVRVIPYGVDGTPLKPSTVATARYGGKQAFLEIHSQTSKAAPGFGFTLPSKDSPFGAYLRGNGLAILKSQKSIEGGGTVPLGFKVMAGGGLGLRYFNFLSLVDSSEPKILEKEVLGLDFSAVAGAGTGKNNQTEPQGAALNLRVLGVSYPIPLAETGVGLMELEYDFVPVDINMNLVDVRFFIGPVPIRILANLKGMAGINTFGKVDPKSMQVTGEIKPFVSSSFSASGGVDAVIAYAKLEASIDPLFSANLTMRFDSNGFAGSPVSVTPSTTPPSGKVNLVAGFYYPCPSLKKIVGFITGDEEVPLCEKKWEYAIFP